MRTFRNNNKRGRFRNNDRHFKRNDDVAKFNSNFSPNSNFIRKVPGRNNHNAPKLIEKYNDLAKEALSNGDKILSESYYQHADHFLRVIENRNSMQNNSKLHLDDSSMEKNTVDKIASEIEDKKNPFSQQP